ncbi:PREDICTED: solute carrier family 35 member C2-like isoform X1 [Priapulus caudatus]|uniref:Solute carrier family 35 member C2-like isoform X1 n=1 Tax=Priapulus caudatus TaxID=37621 RepID=A0ABM1DQ58_PRICU|nr:PREDICTED: solute carrier family 35 member C2-like isoform X1 [Priapulus caudatus]
MTQQTSQRGRRSVCSLLLFLQATKVIGLTVFYYGFSIGLTFYQKWFISDFHYPLSIVICHFVVKFIIAWLLRTIWQCWTSKERINLPWDDYFRRLAPTGICASLDIGLSNWSFEFITISLYTMTKSSCLVYILGFSILFRLEKFRWSLLGVVLTISGGLFLFTYRATQFNLEGFTMVMLASILAGLRWTLAQLVTQRKEMGLSNPIDMIYHVQPWMIVGLLPLAIVYEGVPVATTEKLFREHNIYVALSQAAFTFLGGMIAFFMEMSEYMLLTSTSSLTLSIAGIAKEILTLVLAAKYNGDQMSSINLVGLMMLIAGILLHLILKAINIKDDGDVGDRHENSELIELLGSEDGQQWDADEDEEVVLFQQHEHHSTLV